MILEKFDKNYYLNVTREKMALAIEASRYIENDNNLTTRIISALKTGSVSALEASLNHPAASFFIAAIQDLKQTQE